MPDDVANLKSTMQRRGTPVLAHHRLVAWGAVVKWLLAARAAYIRDANLREQALRAAKSACLNTAEGAGRVSRADKARAYTIARGEVIEAAAAVEIAALCGEASSEVALEVERLAARAAGLLTGLIR